MLLSFHDWQTLCLLAFLALTVNFLLSFVAGHTFQKLNRPFQHIWKGFLQRQEQKLNRQKRSMKTRARRGMLALIFSVILLMGIGSFLTVFLQFPYAEYGETLLLALCLNAGPVFLTTHRILQLISKSGNKSITAAQLPPGFMRRNNEDFDISTVLRGATEALALAFSQGIIAPLFYYLLLGWPGLLLVLGIAQMVHLQGHPNERFRAYGHSAVVLHHALQVIPARLAGIILCIAAIFTPSGRPLQAARLMFRHHPKADYPDAGWPLASMAGLLNVTLGGPRRQEDYTIEEGWVGSGSSKLKPRDLVRARWAFTLAVFLTLMALLCMTPAPFSMFTPSIPKNFTLGF